MKSDEEFKHDYLTYTLAVGSGTMLEREGAGRVRASETLPLMVDWRRAGAVTEVKEQVSNNIQIVLLSQYLCHEL